MSKNFYKTVIKDMKVKMKNGKIPTNTNRYQTINAYRWSSNRVSGVRNVTLLDMLSANIFCEHSTWGAGRPN